MNPSYPRYLKLVLATLAGIVALAGTFNLLIDPLNVTGAPAIQGVNAIKPYLDHHRELVRWQIARRHCASAVILGNSRAEIGLDPTHPAFGALGLEAVNLAIPGTDAATAARFLRWLKAQGCLPRVLIVGVEFFDQLGADASAPPMADELPPQLDAGWAADAVFSLTGLKDSLTTLAVQRQRRPAILTDRGFNPLWHYEDEVARSGHHGLFRQRAVENLRTWERRTRQPRPPGAGISGDDAALQAMLDIAGSAGTEVHLIVYPYHAQLRLLMERQGLGPRFAQWKHDLVRRAAVSEAAGAKARVWDFSGLSVETMEPIPAAGDRRSRMRHYWEAGHFTKALGDRVLEQVLSGQQDFGRRLQAATVRDEVTQDRAAVQRLLDQASPLREDVEQLLVLARPR